MSILFGSATTPFLAVLSFGAIFSGILVITAKNPVISVLFLISVFINVSGYLVVLGVAYLGLVYIIVYVGAIAILFLFVIMMLNLRATELQDTGKAYTQNLPLGTILGALFFFEILSLTSSAYTSSSINGYGIEDTPAISGPAGATIVQTDSFSGSSDDSGVIYLPFMAYNKINNFLFSSNSTPLESVISPLALPHIAFNSTTPDLSFTNSLQIQSIGVGLYTHATLLLVIASFILLLSMVGPIILCMNPRSENNKTLFSKNSLSFSRVGQMIAGSGFFVEIPMNMDSSNFNAGMFVVYLISVLVMFFILLSNVPNKVIEYFNLKIAINSCIWAPRFYNILSYGVVLYIFVCGTIALFYTFFDFFGYISASAIEETAISGLGETKTISKKS